MFDILQRDVPDRPIVSELHEHVRQADLPDIIMGSIGRVTKAAAQYGGPVAPVFTVYHDEEFDPNDITLETCAPVPDIGEAPRDMAMRVEPAHREAYLRLTLEQSMPPRIGEAYAAMGEWVRSHGLQVPIGPREIYLQDLSTAADTDITLELAFPIR